MKNEMEQLTDKDFHFLARSIQSLFRKGGIDCRYCKYAFQCTKKFMETKRPEFRETWSKLQRITGVDIRLHGPVTSKDILAGSWIENFPELYEKFSKMSCEEQEKILQDPEILKYADKYDPENMAETGSL